MKKVIPALLFAATTAATIFVACSNESSDENLPREIITEVESIYELGKCGDENEGDTVYAKKEDAEYYCHNENWIPVSNEESEKSSSSSKVSSSSMTKDELKKFTELCKASGGTTKDGVCVCKKELCDVGAVCNTVTGICGNQSKPTDIPSDPKSSNSSTELTFADLCVASGGKAKDGICICDSERCDKGAVCNTITGVCGNQSKPSDIPPESDPIDPSTDLTFDDLCKASGGNAKDGICVCKKTSCDEGVLCNTITGACGNQSEPVENSSDSKSSSSTEPTFADLCEASGGTENDGVCVCKSSPCDEGVLCNTKSKECANKDVFEKECNDSDKSTCSNSPLGVGIVKECVKGVFVNRSCSTVSCNEEGTECGKCLDDVQTCTEDNNFHATVTRCENGKKVTESCGEKSCNQSNNGCGECTNYEHACTNDKAGKGTVYECVAGEAKKAVSICGNKSCRTDKAICGECLNGELRCDNDINNNAIMYRCVDGQWERLHNKFDPLDKDNYKCPVACREGTDPQKMDYECDINQCSDCDPCWGEPMVGSPSNPNPCYDEKRCKQILKDEDPDYPPFRDFETKNKWKALIPEEKMAVKIVTGYNWKDYTHTDVNDRVGPFEFDLTNETRRVSCNALGTYFGKCHNTLQTCINTSYHKGGFMVVCANGELIDEEKEGDGIACNCEITTNNAEGCCYTRSACFKQTNWSRDRCAKPKSTAADE